MPMIDLFSGNAFSMLTLTDAMNVIPNLYGRIGQIGIFTPQFVPTVTVGIEMQNGVLNLLSTAARGGGKGTVAQPAKRNIRDFRIPHIPHNDFIYADDVNGVRQFGSEMLLKTLQTEVDERLVAMSRKHDITLEHLFAGAIRGDMIDADGSTIYNWFTEFGVTEKVFTFQFSVGTFNVSQEIVRMKTWLDENLLGDTMTGIHVLCSQGWFEALISHPTMVDAYNKYASTQEPLREDVRNRFVHKGVVFEQYVGKATVLNPDGTTTTRAFIPDNTARVIPLGTNDTFKVYYGPSDYLADVNLAGQRRYAKIVPDPSDRFVTVETQQNPLPIVKRPALIPRLALS